MNEVALRKHILHLLDGRNAHLDFETAVAGLPVELRGARVANIPHTPWRLVEHMRICQWDILEFSKNPQHQSPDFPHGYWPDTDAPPDDLAWEISLSQFRDDLDTMRQLVSDPSTDLFAKLPHGDGQTILREALLLADHNAYHIGQLVMLRRALQAWPAD